MADVTLILSQIESGDLSASEKLLPLVYDELKRLAAAKLAQEKPGQTLQATALVHEAYLRLVGSGKGPPAWDSRVHFLCAAATAMRRILIEKARYRKREIHGGGRRRVEIEEHSLVAPEPDEQLLDLDAALKKLAEADAEKARLVELRYFAGLTGEETAKILGISPTTADRHWAYARAWLRREILSGEAN